MTFDIESVTLTARARTVATARYLVDVTATNPDGSVEYQGRLYKVSARADVAFWALHAGVTVEFAPGFPE